MQNKDYFHIQYLNNELEVRKRKNTSYSLRSFAKFLEMPASSLSFILRGKRSVSKDLANKIIDKLALAPALEKQFVSSIWAQKNNLDLSGEDQDDNSATLIEEDKHYRFIAEWEYGALYSLISTKDFVSDIHWMASKLELEPERVHSVISNLIDMGFVQKNDDEQYIIKSGSLKTTSQLRSRALRQSHRESLEIGMEKLEKIPLELRDFSSITFPVNLAKLKKAKELIHSFRKSMATLLDEEATEVYQMSVQLYPMSTITTEQNTRNLDE